MFTNYHHQPAWLVRCKTQDHWAKRYFYDQETPDLCPRCHGPVKRETLHIESPALSRGGDNR